MEQQTNEARECMESIQVRLNISVGMESRTQSVGMESRTQSEAYSDRSGWVSMVPWLH